MHTRKTRLIGAGVTIIVLGVVGLVYAAWTTNGSGSGYAKAGAAQDLSTLDASAETTGHRRRRHRHVRRHRSLVP